MRAIPAILVGLGTVGSAFARAILDQQERLQRNGMHLVGVADTSGWFAVTDLEAVLQRKATGQPLSATPWSWGDDAGVLVDASVGDQGTMWRACLNRGWSIVSANKSPVADPNQDWRDPWLAERLWLGGTVGAGVPSASVLRQLLRAGDDVRMIRGVVSGTLSTVLGDVQDGMPLSQSIEQARLAGITEPDPSKDLSGLDVARKLTILGKLAGLWSHPPVVDVQPLTLAAVQKGLGQPGRLEYVGTASPDGVQCRLRCIGPDDPLGRLTAKDNAVCFHTDRFSETPLTLFGPSRGPSVTAKTLLADVLAAAVRLRR
ncbi:MAG: hypothetical protein AB8H79_09745 [Myxococcota bacterium]